MPGDGCRTPMRAPSPPPQGKGSVRGGAEGQTARHPSLARRRCCIFQPGSIYIITLQFVARLRACAACLPPARGEAGRGGARRGGAGWRRADRLGRGGEGWGWEGRSEAGRGGKGWGRVRRGGAGRRRAERGGAE